MKELLANFLAFCAELKAKANAVLATLPPIEQFEANQELSYGIRSVQRYANELKETAENLEGKMNQFATKAEEAAAAAAAATAEATLLAKVDSNGKPLYIKAAESEGAVTAAVLAKETEVKTAMTAEFEKKNKISQRRIKLVSDKTLPAIAASNISDAVLGADNADAGIEKVKERLARLKKLGLTEANCESLVGQAASLAVDEAGEKAFNASLATVEAAVKASRGTGSGNPLLGAPNRVAASEGAMALI